MVVSSVKVTERMRSQIRNEFPLQGVWGHPRGQGEHLIMMPPGRPLAEVLRALGGDPGQITNKLKGLRIPCSL